MPPFHPSPASSPLCRLSLRTPIRTFTTTPSRPLSKISIVGRLAAEPELTPTSTGQDMIRYAVGTGHGPRDNRTTSWWQVRTFMPEGPGRDTLMSLGKGSLLYIEGECKMNKFQNKEGSQQTAVSITQRSFEVLERRDSNGNRINYNSGSSEEAPE